MQLKEFVKIALLELISAVDEAKNELDLEGSLICAPLGPAYTKDFGMKIDAFGRYYQKVEFDIAVTVAEESCVEGTMSAKAGVLKVCGISADLEGSISANNSTVSRVKFHVPIALQCTNLKKSDY
jgi:hypothetical protein